VVRKTIRDVIMEVTLEKNQRKIGQMISEEMRSGG